MDKVPPSGERKSNIEAADLPPRRPFATIFVRVKKMQLKPSCLLKVLLNSVLTSDQPLISYHFSGTKNLMII